MKNCQKMKMHLLFDDIAVLNQFHAQIVQMHLQDRVQLWACSIQKQVRQKIWKMLFMKSPLSRERSFALMPEIQKRCSLKAFLSCFMRVAINSDAWVKSESHLKALSGTRFLKTHCFSFSSSSSQGQTIYKHRHLGWQSEILLTDKPIPSNHVWRFQNSVDSKE